MSGLITNFLYFFNQQRYIYLLFLATCLLELFSYEYLAWSVFALIVFIKYFRQTFQIKNLFILSFIFGLSYGIIQSITGDNFSYVSAATFIFTPCIFLIYGNYVATNLKSQNQGVWFWIIAILAFSIPIFYIILNSISQHQIILVTRNLENVQFGIAKIGATMAGTFVSLGLVGLGYAFIDWKSTKDSTKWWFLAIFILSLLTNIHVLNRTGLVIAVVAFLIMAMCVSSRKMVSILMILVVVILILQFFFPEDTWDKILQGYDTRDTESQLATGNDRLPRWIDAVSKLFTYPFGWWTNSLTYHDYVHNFFLDTARVGGLIPFFCLIFIVIIATKELIKLAHYRKDNKLIILIIGLNVCFMINAMIEPIIEGNFMIVLLYFTLIGFQHGLLKKLEKRNSTE